MCYEAGGPHGRRPEAAAPEATAAPASWPLLGTDHRTIQRCFERAVTHIKPAVHRVTVKGVRLPWMAQAGRASPAPRALLARLHVDRDSPPPLRRSPNRARSRAVPEALPAAEPRRRQPACRLFPQEQVCCCGAANWRSGHKQPPAMQKRLGQGQTYNPDRDRLLKRMSPSWSFRPEGSQAMSRARTWRSSIGRRRIKLIGCQRCPADSVRRCVFTGQPNSGMTNRARVGSLFASAPNRAR
jgi:hypothetical protein